MIAPRPLLIGAAGALALLIAGCSTFSSSAATVEGHDIATDDFQSVLADIGAAGFPGVEVDEQTGTMEGDTARIILGLMVRDEATSRFLSAAGQSITDADREDFLSNVSDEERAQLDGMSEEASRLLVDSSAVSTTLARVEAPSAAELQRRYEDRPISTGLLCLRHILVPTEEDARDVLDELAAGADFAALATERSTDETSAANGGALGTDDAPCTDLDTARQSLDPQFLAGALDARVGVATAPIESQFGWHVVLARPFDEVGESIVARYDDDAGNLGLAGALATAEISVDPRYGSWDPAAANVVGLG